MSQSIGMMLSSLANLSPQSMQAGDSMGAPSTSSSFADQLDASLHARAKRLGLELPQSKPAERAASETVDDIWARVQREDSATNGVVDAIMRSLADAADARYERRHHRGSGLFDI